MIPALQTQIERVIRRQRQLQLWRRLSICWAAAACLGLGLLAVERQRGWSSSLALPAVALAALVAAVLLVTKQRRVETDCREVATAIETHHPELDGRLLTAVQQRPQDDGELNYLQLRLIDEVLRLSRQSDWSNSIPGSRLAFAQLTHWVALCLFVVTLLGLRVPPGHGIFTREFATSVTVTPGDATLERGSTLVVLARFAGPLPATVELVAGQPSGTTQRIPLVKSLADPMFGGSVPEVASNLIYHVEYAGTRTRDFHLTVFEYPRLESADASLVYPDYTRQPPQRIENTRRVTAVEGSHVDLALHLNKPVTSAQLVARGNERSVLPLLVDTNHPSAELTEFPLATNATYELRLVDAEGRTNKVQSQFVFAVLKNRTPELHLTLPRGDVRPSPLEEVSFEGNVWDDFGVKAYGLGYAMVGKETKYIELGRDVPGKERRPFQYLLRLEELAVEPDQLLSWFVWADDIGPDGQVRRTTGDLFFAEVRPFEEVFREGQGMDGESQQQAGQQGESRSGRLAELQKQIISATWRLLKDQSGSREGSAKPGTPPAVRPTTNGAVPIPEGTSHRPESPLRFSRIGFLAAVGAGEPTGPGESAQPKAAASRSDTGDTAPAKGASSGYEADAGVVRDSQAQALEQANTALSRQQDPRASALWSNASKEMEKALSRLTQAAQSPAALPEALAAEQAAYQALLKLQEHEYQVSRSRSRNQRGGGQGQQMQRQLEQMDLTQSENRYETQRLAQSPQNPQRREQLQVMNRLQELARRQQDLNDRLKELQTALQEARTEQEREEIRRRLKRLQEQEQQMLADVDELRQRMDRPENQSTMNEERRQLDQTREDVQSAAQQAAEGAASQALASGTRAQRQFQQLHDEMRQRNSSQFSDELRDMRNEARELARQQEELTRKMGTQDSGSHKSLTDAPDQQAMLNELARQRERLTNLVDRATQVSQQAEQAEPVLSRQLYDSVRQFAQDTAKGVSETQDQLLQRRAMTRNLYDQLKEGSEPDGAKLVDATAELLRLGNLPEASETSRRVGANLDQLKRGVERAAESVLGDEAEAMRLAQQQLDQLTEELQKEMTQLGSGGSQTNLAPADNSGQAGERDGSQRVANANSGQSQNQDSTSQARQPGDGRGQNQGERSQQDAGGESSFGGARASGQRTEYGGGGAARSLDNEVLRPTGPITGADYGPWTERLRDVEDMLDQPDLRNRVAVARDRVRLIRQEYKNDRKKPDWLVVRLQVMKPLQEVRDRLTEELARLGSKEALVPIDRDPVPNRYSELVRRYYEELGKDKRE